MRISPAAYPTSIRPAARTPLAAAAQPALSSAEVSRIQDAFPDQPAVTQKLYGRTREVQTPEALGTTLDLSA